MRAVHHKAVMSIHFMSAFIAHLLAGACIDISSVEGHISKFAQWEQLCDVADGVVS